MLSDEWLVRYTPLELLDRKTLKLFHERDGSRNKRTNEQLNKRMNEQTNIQTDERKDENYIPVIINAGGIIKLMQRQKSQAVANLDQNLKF